MHPDSYTVLSAPVRAEQRIKGSRFVALVHPVGDEDEAARLRAELAAEYADASHHCWALCLGHPRSPTLRHSDAGEPAGSAGAAIARALAASDLSDLLCVVVRWFGGIKLGVGGLIRAYGGTARLALAEARPEERLELRRASCEFAYEFEPALRSLLERQAGRIEESRYELGVSWTIVLPPSAVSEFAERGRDLTGGSLVFEISSEGEES